MDHAKTCVAAAAASAAYGGTAIGLIVWRTLSPLAKQVRESGGKTLLIIPPQRCGLWAAQAVRDGIVLRSSAAVAEESVVLVCWQADMRAAAHPAARERLQRVLQDVVLLGGDDIELHQNGRVCCLDGWTQQQLASGEWRLPLHALNCSGHVSIPVAPWPNSPSDPNSEWEPPMRANPSSQFSLGSGTGAVCPEAAATGVAEWSNPQQHSGWSSVWAAACAASLAAVSCDDAHAPPDALDVFHAANLARLHNFLSLGVVPAAWRLFWSAQGERSADITRIGKHIAAALFSGEACVGAIFWTRVHEWLRDPKQAVVDDALLAAGRRRRRSACLRLSHDARALARREYRITQRALRNERRLAALRSRSAVAPSAPRALGKDTLISLNSERPASLRRRFARWCAALTERGAAALPDVHRELDALEDGLAHGHLSQLRVRSRWLLHYERCRRANGSLPALDDAPPAARRAPVCARVVRAVLPGQRRLFSGTDVSDGTRVLALDPSAPIDPAAPACRWLERVHGALLSNPAAAAQAQPRQPPDDPSADAVIPRPYSVKLGHFFAAFDGRRRPLLLRVWKRVVAEQQRRREASLDFSHITALRLLARDRASSRGASAALPAFVRERADAAMQAARNAAHPAATLPDAAQFDEIENAVVSILPSDSDSADTAAWAAAARAARARRLRCSAAPNPSSLSPPSAAAAASASPAGAAAAVGGRDGAALAAPSRASAIPRAPQSARQQKLAAQRARKAAAMKHKRGPIDKFFVVRRPGSLPSLAPAAGSSPARRNRRRPPTQSPARPRQPSAPPASVLAATAPLPRAPAPPRTVAPSPSRRSSSPPRSSPAPPASASPPRVSATSKLPAATSPSRSSRSPRSKAAGRRSSPYGAARSPAARKPRRPPPASISSTVSPARRSRRGVPSTAMATSWWSNDDRPRGGAAASSAISGAGSSGSRPPPDAPAARGGAAGVPADRGGAAASSAASSSSTLSSHAPPVLGAAPPAPSVASLAAGLALSSLPLLCSISTCCFRGGQIHALPAQYRCSVCAKVFCKNCLDARHWNSTDTHRAAIFLLPGADPNGHVRRRPFDVGSLSSSGGSSSGSSSGSASSSSSSSGSTSSDSPPRAPSSDRFPRTGIG